MRKKKPGNARKTNRRNKKDKAAATTGESSSLSLENVINGGSAARGRGILFVQREGLKRLGIYIASLKFFTDSLVEMRRYPLIRDDSDNKSSRARR